MQKFGLNTQRATKLNAVELEITREKATALGRAGRKLRLCLEDYQQQLEMYQHQLEAHQSQPEARETNHQKATSAFTNEDVLIKNIADSAWALILQREFLGFTEGNLKWITENYRIPHAALNRLGKSGH